MEFSPEVLRKQAQVLVEKRIKKDRGVTAAYLRGSLLYGSPLLGGAGDIDLVFVHNQEPEKFRELIPITPEIHIDLEHHDQSQYHKSREIRVDPWLGPTLQDAEPLYDPRHFLDYTQSGVRSNFLLPENILARSTPLLESARQFWLERQVSQVQGSVSEVKLFLDAVQKAVNAVSLLSGPPLPTRRLGLVFPSRAESFTENQLPSLLHALLGGPGVSLSQLQDWLPAWENTLKDAYPSESSSLPHPRIRYYLLAIKALLEGEHQTGALWPLFFTWTEAVSLLSQQGNLQRSWIQASTALGFAGKDYLLRLDLLDQFLDQAEQALSVFNPGHTP